MIRQSVRRRRPGRSAFLISLEFDQEKDGSFSTAETFNGGSPVTTGLVLTSEFLLDGNGAADTSFASGLVELATAIPSYSNVRLIFDTQGVGQTWHYIFGVNDVLFRIVAPGDTDGNGEVDTQDVQNILAAAKFGLDTPEDEPWGVGDFDGNGNVGPLDIQLLSAVAQFDAVPYVQQPLTWQTPATARSTCP